MLAQYCTRGLNRLNCGKIQNTLKFSQVLTKFTGTAVEDR